jgi:hypothetical protein
MHVAREWIIVLMPAGVGVYSAEGGVTRFAVVMYRSSLLGWNHTRIFYPHLYRVIKRDKPRSPFPLRTCF